MLEYFIYHPTPPLIVEHSEFRRIHFFTPRPGSRYPTHSPSRPGARYPTLSIHQDLRGRGGPSSYPSPIVTRCFPPIITPRPRWVVEFFVLSSQPSPLPSCFSILGVFIAIFKPPPYPVVQAELSNARRELISEVTGLGRSLFSSQQELRQTLQAEVASSVRMVSGEVRMVSVGEEGQKGLRNRCR